MNPRQYLKDYYSNSPNDNILNQLSNFGSEVGGGKSFINGLANGVSDIVRLPAKGFATLGSLAAGQDPTRRQNQIDDFFKIDALQPSVKEYPTINTLGNTTTILGGGTLGGISKTKPLVSKALEQVAGTLKNTLVGNILQTTNDNLKNSTNNSIQNYGKAFINGLGSTIAKPVTIVNNGLGSFADYINNTDHSALRDKQNKNINNFFNYS